jgi:hypothetical protein
LNKNRKTKSELLVRDFQRMDGLPRSIPTLMKLRSYLAVFCVPVAAGAADFVKDVQPILEKHCYECHSEKTGKKKAGYVFDDLETLKLDINPKGAIVPGKPSESHVFVVVSDPNHEAHMPPRGNLSDREIDKLRSWINEGAQLPGQTVAKAEEPVKMETQPAVLSWTNFEGKTIQAGFVRLDGANVVLKMPNGQEIPYPLAKLDKASQEQAETVASAGAP